MTLFSALLGTRSGLTPLGLLLAAGLIVVGCTRAPDIIGIDNPEQPVAATPGTTQHKIFLASTRRGTEAAGALFSSERAPDLGFASVQVSVPPNHVTGQLERARRLPPDPRTEFAIVDPVVYANDAAFLRSLNAALGEFPRGSRDILFFVHGYNNTTSDSLLRLAQFIEDSSYEGVAVLFDWASAASITRYVYDLNSVLIARPHLFEFAELMVRSDVDRFDVFAHSMGSLLVMESLAARSREGQLNGLGKLDHIILASPDIDMDLFRAQVRDTSGVDLPLYVLLSKDDAALGFSQRIAGGVPRVGASDANELADLGVVAIDLSEIDDSAAGSHSKFAGSPDVVQLIGRGLNNSQNFSQAQRAATLGDTLRGVPITIVFE